MDKVQRSLVSNQVKPKWEEMESILLDIKQ